MRGIRGAINVTKNTKAEIRAKTRELLEAIVAANRFDPDDIAAAFFTLTPDLNAEFPAAAAREIGWKHVPMICSIEVGVPGAMKRVIRVMLLVNTRTRAREIRHQYLGDTPCLRPDLAKSDGATARSRSSRRSSASTKTSAGGRP